MVKRIYVLYDESCGVCSRLRSWIIEQPAYLEIEFVPAGSDDARRLFPELCHDDGVTDLLVVTDEGDVYIGSAAWIICLYALVEYRDWSYRFARGPLRPLARQAWELLSANRGPLSRLLELKSDAELRRQIEELPSTQCGISRTT